MSAVAAEKLVKSVERVRESHEGLRSYGLYDTVVAIEDEAAATAPALP